MIRASLGCLCLIICAALTMFLWGACDADLYYDVQTAQNVQVDFDMRACDDALADYLSGDINALENTPFGERAIYHMKDVFDIFAVCRKIRIISLIAGILLVLSAMNRDRAKRLFRGAWIGLAIFAVPLIAIGIWAAIDFAGAFEAMHKLLFSNDMYLLYADEPLIQMLPERFFVHIGLRLGIKSLIGAITVPLMATVIWICTKFKK